MRNGNPEASLDSWGLGRARGVEAPCAVFARAAALALLLNTICEEAVSASITHSQGERSVEVYVEITSGAPALTCGNGAHQGPK